MSDNAPTIDEANERLTNALRQWPLIGWHTNIASSISVLLTAYAAQAAVEQVWREEALEFSRKLADRHAEYAALEEKFEKMRHAGSLLSNAAFNLSQPSVTLTDDARRSLKESQLAWDAALSGTENTP